MIRGAIRRAVVVVLMAALIPAFTAYGDERVRYDNWMAVRVEIRSADQIAKIHELGALLMSDGEGVGRVDYILPPGALDEFESIGVTYQVLNRNIQEAIDAESVRLQQGGTRAWFDDYKSYADINAYMDALISQYPDLISKELIGTSIEGRNIYALTITSPTGGPDKPALFFDGLHHAREWVGGSTVMYIVDRLVQTHDTDPAVQLMLDKLVFYVIPIVNPDGYVYTWSTNRMWRKNRRNNGGGIYGVDLNRNYSIGWGGVGSSGNPSDETYRGTAPFSEPESSTVRDFVLAHPDIVAHIDFHSYSQLVLRPYGYDYVDPPEPDNGVLTGLGDGMAAAIFSTHGKTYTSQPSYDLYLADGICSDWVYDGGGAYSWTIELRDTGLYGFVLPADQIIPTAEESYAAISVLADYFSLLLKFQYPNGLPAIVAADQTNDVDVTISDVSATYLSNSAKVFYRVGGGAFTESAMVPAGGGSFVATLPSTPCGQQIEYYFQAETTGGGTVTDPYDAPTTLYASDAYEITVTLADDMEADLGWSVGSVNDDATTGVWNRMDPQPTDAQPGDDHTAIGTICWVTDGAAGSSVGANDIDGGQTTLTSPTLDLSGASDPVISYWRWYSNDAGASPNEDLFVIDISDDGGSTWTNVETVGPAGVETSGGWYYHEFNVAGIVSLTANVQVRFIASDEGSGSIVEAAIDDFSVVDVGCSGSPCPGDLDGDGDRDLADLSGLLAHYGATGVTPAEGDFDGDGDVDLSDLSGLLSVYGVPCP